MTPQKTRSYLIKEQVTKAYNRGEIGEAERVQEIKE